jgi:hypothetical protein
MFRPAAIDRRYRLARTAPSCPAEPSFSFLCAMKFAYSCFRGRDVFLKGFLALHIAAEEAEQLRSIKDILSPRALQRCQISGNAPVPIYEMGSNVVRADREFAVGDFVKLAGGDDHRSVCFGIRARRKRDRQRV